MSFEDKVLRMIAVKNAIPLDGSVSILTGSNGSGKSLVRQQINFRTKEHGKKVIHSSMELRTGLHSNLGGMGVFLRDSGDNPTSVETFSSIRKAIQSCKDHFLCLDEIEVGCSEETLMGLVAWINENMPKDALGVMIITHSRFVVENLKHDHFFNLDGIETEEEWLNREIVPVDIEKLKKDSFELYRYIVNREKKEKE